LSRKDPHYSNLFNYIWAPLIKFAEFIGIKKKTLPLSWLSNKDIANLLYLAGLMYTSTIRKLLIPYNIPLLSYLFNRIIEKLPLFHSLTINNFVFARPLPKTDDVAKKYSVTVVIPARNESGNIENAILRLPGFSKHLEIIFVEGNSTDDTWEKIKEIQLKYKDTHDIRITQQEGKGKATL